MPSTSSIERAGAPLTGAYAACATAKRGSSRTRSIAWRDLLAAVVFGVVAAVLSLHVWSTLSIPGVADDGRAGLTDFRDQAYYPVASLLEGSNPYDPESHMQRHPAVKVFAPYSPVMLALFLPLGLMPLWLAQVSYQVVNIGLIVVLAALALRLSGRRATPIGVFALGSLILVSRPGEWNTILGQFGGLAAVATYVALGYSERSALIGGLGLAVCMFKPTFGLPVCALMLAHGRRRAVATGIAAAAIVSAAIVTVLARAAGGLEPFLSSLWRGYSFWRLESGQALESPLRIDAVAVLARSLGHSPGPLIELATSVLIIGLGFALIRGLRGKRGDPSPTGLTLALSCLVILTAFYHMPYDLLLLVLPLTWLYGGARRATTSGEAALYWTLFALLVLPMANYLTFGRMASSLGLVGFWREAIIAANGWTLLTALALWAPFAVWRRRATAQQLEAGT